MALLASKAGRICAVAMQLDHLVVGKAGRLMQSVDILCDDGRHFPRPDKRGYSEMSPCRLGVPIKIVHHEFPPPRFAPGFRTLKKGLKRNRLVAHPRRAGRAKIGTPLSVEIPAPVNPAIVRDARINSWSSVIDVGSVSGMKLI